MDMQTEPRVPYVFLLGLAHSGSTLLTFLLNAHPEIATIGEIERLRTFIPDRWSRKSDSCSCGRPFYECPFWNRVLAGFAARGHGFDEIDYFAYRPSQKPVADEKLKALAESVIDVSQKRIFLDASKYPRFLGPLSANPHLDLRVINLYRDGRATVNSWLRHLRHRPAYKRLPENWREHALLRPLITGRIIWEWRRREKERQRALTWLPAGSYYSVKYEELCAAPAGTLEKIFDFLQVDAEADLETGFKSEVEHHIIGNQMRLNRQEKIILDEKWRTQMKPDMLSAFRLLGGERLNQHLGYR